MLSLLPITCIHAFQLLQAFSYALKITTAYYPGCKSDCKKHIPSIYYSNYWQQLWHKQFNCKGQYVITSLDIFFRLFSDVSGTKRFYGVFPQSCQFCGRSLIGSWLRNVLLYLTSSAFRINDETQLGNRSLFRSLRQVPYISNMFNDALVLRSSAKEWPLERAPTR